MEFIKKNLVREAYKDVMEVKVFCSHGEYEIYTDFAISGFCMEDAHDVELLTDLVETLNRMNFRYQDRNFNNIEGFARWFRKDLLSDETLKALSPRLKELSVDCEWVWDYRYQDVYATLYYFIIYYYDENGDVYRMGLNN